MFAFLFIISCANKDRLDISNDTTTENSESDSLDSLDIPVRQMLCKLMEMHVENNANGNTDMYTTTYTWDGNIQFFNGGSYTYNDYGYLTEAHYVQENWEQITSYTYDCDKWCKILRISTGNEVEDLVYTWQGNTQYQGEENYWVYNDFGYLIESYNVGSSYETTSHSTYECDVWCKLMTQTWTTIMNEIEDSQTTEYHWDETLQTWDDGYVQYNAFGYVTESYTITGDGSNLQQYTYDCD